MDANKELILPTGTAKSFKQVDQFLGTFLLLNEKKTNQDNHYTQSELSGAQRNIPVSYHTWTDSRIILQ